MTMKHILASTALTALLAGGAYAQTEPAADPATDPATPTLEEGATGSDTMATDPAVPAESDTMATDPAAPAESDTMATDPAVPAESDTMATDPAVPAESDSLATDPAAPMESDTMAAEGEWAPVDLATFSTDRLIGADIVTAQGENETIASIEDVLISDTGEVENVVAQFGGFLGFGANKVLLAMDEIEVMEDASGNLLVRSSLTPESIESRPVYEE